MWYFNVVLCKAVFQFQPPFYLYTISGISPLVRSQECPTDWELFEDSCYRYLPGILTTWNNAQIACNSAGGNLASISSLAQNQHIYDKMLEYNPQLELNNYWIGMSKDGAGKSMSICFIYVL